MNEDTRENNKLIIVAIVSLIVGVALGAVMFGSKASDTPKSTMKDDDGVMSDTSNSDTAVLGDTDTRTSPTIQDSGVTAVKIGGSTLTVTDQVSGGTVLIDSVLLAKDAWVVVHEDRDGMIGNILGAQYLQAGSYESVIVTLLRDTMPETRNYVTIYIDDGDRLFDYKKDSMVTNESGGPIAVAFQTHARNVDIMGGPRGMSDGGNDADAMMEATN